MKLLSDLKRNFNLAIFIKCGCSVFSLLLILFAVANFVVPSITVSLRQDDQKAAIHSVYTEEKKVALSFDVTWGSESTASILEILNKHQIKSTFFMTGEWIENFPDEVMAIAEAGHDLGNYSEHHEHLADLNQNSLREEITMTHEKIKELTGIEMNLFRPPYGEYDNQLIEACSSLGYHCIKWSIDSLDWKDYGAENIVTTVLDHDNLDNGAIILLHNGTTYTKDALERIIIGLQNTGYEIVPVSELIYTENCYTDSTGIQLPDAPY